MREDKLPIVTGPEVSSTGQAEGFGDQQPPISRMCPKDISVASPRLLVNLSL